MRDALSLASDLAVIWAAFWWIDDFYYETWVKEQEGVEYSSRTIRGWVWNRFYRYLLKPIYGTFRYLKKALVKMREEW